MSTRRKTRKSSSSRRHDADEWKQFTSPDGHSYYYNAATKESRWELPTEETARVKHRRPKEKSLNEEKSLKQVKSLNEEPKKDKKRPEADANATPKPKNAMFQKLQASLEGRLNGPMMGMRGPPPILQIRHDEVPMEQEETKTPSLEEQYEAETAGMSAAERLRFLRKKRQENMMTKKESSAGDDFMAEVANNMKKKGVTVKPKQERKDSEKRPNWKEQERAEEERKRLQMQAEQEAKEQEAARKEREQQAAKEREQRREQERAEQLELERRREQERKQHQENLKQEHEEKVKGEGDSERDTVNGDGTNTTEPDVRSCSSVSDSTTVQGEDSDPSSPERVKNKSRSRSRGRKHSDSNLSVHRDSINPADNVEDDQPPAENEPSVHSGITADPVQDEKQRTREERRSRKLREKELVAAKPNLVTSESPRRKSMSGSNGLDEEPKTRSKSSIETEEETRASEKQLRPERRRMAKVEAALAAQNLNNNGVQQERTPDKRSEEHPDSRNDPTSGSGHAGGYTMGEQPVLGQPPFSGGMYPPYPYMMPPPPPSPYGYYYPYMQTPPMSMAMYPGMMPPGYQVLPQTPPPSANGVAAPSALVPYGTDSTLANAYGYDMNFGGAYGQQPAPELNRCDLCKGIGVGLVEKNGVCAHCNRLRLAFIVDSAQMRQSCSVCGGWGFQLLQANGMCEHCTRQTAQKSQAKFITEGQRRSATASVTRTVVEAAPFPQKSTKNDGLDDIDWDKSSDDSDWDD